MTTHGVDCKDKKFHGLRWDSVWTSGDRLHASSTSILIAFLTLMVLIASFFFQAPKPVGRRSRKPGLDRKPRQAYSAKQLERLESEFKVRISSSLLYYSFHYFPALIILICVDNVIIQTRRYV
jgi:hypothetical protein